MRYVRRNFFTLLFSIKRIGKRKTKVKQEQGIVKKRTKMQIVRRSRQGKKNRIYGMWYALQVRNEFGRRKPVHWWRKQ